MNDTKPGRAAPASTDWPDPKSLDELYQLWNDSQNYISRQISDLEAKIDNQNKNLAKLLEHIKGRPTTGEKDSTD